ncbi:MOSC domain-containing protein [Aliarcobacter faecis]|uniref:MOSC domain-containing protein n=1 Tax=Aliarcobacter faecis TaxID=1564138 RepID=UPI00047E0F70|nr:MOSC domain-containing protein [Aliarcobacter faecis]QKF72948.1 MOSC domain-containing protein [Aliarcobacter faecis]
MNNIGRVIEIFSATKDSSGLPRPKVENLNLIEDYGIEFDKFAGKKLDQTVMIVGLKSYEIAKYSGIELVFGSLGENILLDFDPHNFEVGTIFKIGNALIQTTQICTVCNHLNVFAEELPNLLKGHRGVYCKILKSGMIEKNMKVEIYNV